MKNLASRGDFLSMSVCRGPSCRGESWGSVGVRIYPILSQCLGQRRAFCPKFNSIEVWYKETTNCMYIGLEIKRSDI